MSEQKIQSDIIRFLKEHDAYAVKTIVTSKAGTPDILACFNGRFLAIEVKSPDGRLTVLQERTLQKIRGCGGIAVVARSVEDVKKAMEE